jgi:hypothetical protein
MQPFLKHLGNKQLFRQTNRLFAPRNTVIAYFTSPTNMKAVDYALQIGQLDFAKRDNNQVFN